MLSFSITLIIITMFLLHLINHLISSFTIKMAPPRQVSPAALPHQQHLARPNLRCSRPKSSQTNINKHTKLTTIDWGDKSGSYMSTFDEPTYYTDDIIFCCEQSTSTTAMNNSHSSMPTPPTVVDTLLLHIMETILRLAVALSSPYQPIKFENINQIHITH